MPAPKKDVYRFIGKNAEKLANAAHKKWDMKGLKQIQKLERKEYEAEYDLKHGYGLDKAIKKIAKAEKKITKKESKANKRGLKAANEPTRASKRAKKGK